MQQLIKREKLDLNLYKEMEGKDYIIKPNGNIIYSLGPDFYYEYISKYPYYQIVRTFYPDNLLKNKSYCLDLVSFGKTIHYDEKGKLSVIDEDKKFGKIKLDFILMFMEKKGLINLKTGEGGFNFKKGNISYRLTFGNLDIKKEKKYWVVTDPATILIENSHSRFPYKDQNWYIDGETGQVYTEEEFINCNKTPKTTTFNGKTYTEEEWKAFEQEQWEKYQSKRKKKSFWDRVFG